MLPCLLCFVCILIASSVNILRISAIVLMVAFVNLILKKMMMMMMMITTCVFVGSLAEIDARKVAEVVRGSRHIRSLQYSAIRSDIGSPIIKHLQNICKNVAKHFLQMF